MLSFFILAGFLAISIGSILLSNRLELHIFFRIVLWVIGIGSACAFTVLLFVTVLFWQPEPPDLAMLANNFSDRRETLTELLGMSNVDTHYSRIDPTFINYGAVDGTPGGQSMWGDTNSPLPTDRWKRYRKLFSRAKLDQGIARDADGNVFFMAGSIGLLDRGHSTGYLFCRDPGSQSSQQSRFEPCTVPPQESGSRAFLPEPRVEADSFKRVADHWYVFSQGPS